MKTLLLIVSILFTLSIGAIAQPGPEGKGGRPDPAMIEAIKVAYMTKKLGLNADEAQKFWPVYNRYMDDLKKVRQDNKQDELAFEEKALEIRKRCREDFRKILGQDERVNRVFTADREFRDMIRKELQDRQRMRGGRNMPGRPGGGRDN